MSDSPSPPELKRINLALKVLQEACPRTANTTAGTTEVRLALRVLGPHVEAGLLLNFWKIATEQPRRPWRTCMTPYGSIVLSLIKRGYAVWDEVIPSHIQLSQQSPEARHPN